MQLVLVDTSNAICGKGWSPYCRKNMDLFLSVSNEELRSQVLERLEISQDSPARDRVRNKVISDILSDNIRDGGVNVKLSLNDPERMVTITIIPFIPFKGCLIRNLWNLFGEEVKISVHLKYAPNKDEELLDFASLEGITIDEDDGVLCKCSGTTSFTMKKSKFDKDPSMAIKLVADIPETTIFTKMMPLGNGKKVLEDDSFSDVTITAGNGAKIKGHKCFLSVCSPVLAAMLKSGMGESQTGQLDMSDVSEKSVRAFLGAVYHGDLTLPKGDVAVAFELLYIGHKYDVPMLEAEMMRRLIQRNDFCFSAKLAFKIYMFVRNIISMLELKEKTIKILKSRLAELQSLQEYNDLFEKPSNSKTAKEIFVDFAKPS